MGLRREPRRKRSAEVQASPGFSPRPRFYRHVKLSYERRKLSGCDIKKTPFRLRYTSGYISSPMTDCTDSPSSRWTSASSTPERRGDVREVGPVMSKSECIVKYLKENGRMKLMLNDVGRVLRNVYWNHPLNSTLRFAEELVNESNGELRIRCYNNVILLELADEQNYDDFDQSYPEQLEFLDESSFRKATKRCWTCCCIS
ncbi:hypothetical protein QR680_009905 [Steinernema hermaphroditum]|uniref:Uncharacterized protein n=1 Tax=Steinernema hermaphroditum TaxID=289476 RepID=A0AA39MAR3_9BILA|nr:hypothetical protein QR680_009905 [Steinernema hermaphroditum]